MRDAGDTREDGSHVDRAVNGNDRPDMQREAFWSLVVGVPTVLSILRLWVEAGGELQTTLLLVSHVGPLNVVAALFATATHLVTVVLVALFSAGGILRAATQAASPRSRLRAHPPILVRLRVFTPFWFIIGTFALAALTWKFFYLPLLLPALAATFQRAPWEIDDRRWVGMVISVAALASYFLLVNEAVRYAWQNDERRIAVLLVAPPLVAFLVTGPIPETFARFFAPVSTLALIPLAILVLIAAQTPVLPLVAVEVTSPDAPPTASKLMRGYIVDINDLHLILLEEHGGVKYLDPKQVSTTALCSEPTETRAFTTEVHGFHVEDSPVMAFGRRVRPKMETDQICLIAPSK